MAIEKINRRYSSNLGFSKVEAFDVLFQEGAEGSVGMIMKLNDCPFHKFWYSLIGDEHLVTIYAVPVHRKNRQWNWPLDKDREGIELLIRSFKSMWSDRDPIWQYSCGTHSVENSFDTDHILLSGGSVSNLITRNYFDHFKGIRYAIGYDMPDYTNIRIYDRVSSKNIYATYKDSELGHRIPDTDIGILTVMRNPINETKYLIGCMGIHSFGSLGCYKVLSNQRLLNELMQIIEIPLRNKGYQILLAYDVTNDKVRLQKRTLHKF